jgi:hypothetical protein
MYRRLLFWARRLLLIQHRQSHDEQSLRDGGLHVHDPHGKYDIRVVRGQIVSLQVFHRLIPEVKKTVSIDRGQEEILECTSLCFSSPAFIVSSSPNST